MKIKYSFITIILSTLLVGCEKLPHCGDTIIKENVYVKIDVSESDSYGGCRILITVNNYTNKIIKKIKVETLIKNYYNEPLQDYITNQYYINFQLTGPIKPGITQRQLIDKFYNSSAYYADITECKIIFE
jgi:hypothetical protein